MRPSLFAAFVLSLELGPAAAMRIPMPLQSPSPLLSSGESRGRGAEHREMEMAMVKRRPRDRHGSTSRVKEADEDEDEERPSRDRRPHKGHDDDEMHEATSNDNERQTKSGKGKKQKHIPGDHHREDRVPPVSTQSGHGKGRAGKHGKRYLSSNPRHHAKRSFSVWDYDRHSKRMGDFDPLHGTGLREEKRGHGREDRDEDGKEGRHGGRDESKDQHHSSKADHGDRYGKGPDHSSFAALAEDGTIRGDSLPKERIGTHSGGMVGVQAKGVPSHRQGVTMGDGSTGAHSLAAALSKEPHPQHEERGLLDGLLVDGILDMDYEAYDCEDDSPLATHPHYLRRDGEGDGQPQGEGTPPPASAGPPAAVSVVDGGPRMYADRIIWQPKSVHPEKDGGLQKRRKNKNKNKHGRHGDDDEEDYEVEDEDGGRGKGKDRHRGGDDEEEENSYGASSTSSRKEGKDRYDDEEDDGYGGRGDEDDYDGPRSKSKSDKHAAYGGDDDHPSSKSSQDEYDGPASSSKFDDGQYHPSAYSDADDCATLSSFYTSMRGETWTPVVDWSSSISSRSTSSGGAIKGKCCTWTGVICDEYHRVIGLNLPNQGLTGPLSEELFSLDALLRLDISGNAITAMPDKFTSIPTLANINAASNNLTGSIPTSLLSHPTLKTLNLASNAFVGDVSINSVNLTSVALGKNQLASFHVLEGRGLVKVDISENAFQGPLPDMSSSLDLQIFDASSNNTGNLFDLSRMTALTRLDVRSNSLSGPFPPTLAHLKRLTSLYLSYNAFTGAFPSEPAPPALSSCYVMPNQLSPCPSDADLANPSSLASKCHAACPKQGARTAGIPVSPLPGEAGQGMPLYLHHSSSYVLAPDVNSQPQSQSQPPTNLNGVGSVNDMPMPAAYNQPPPAHNVNPNGMVPPAAINNVGMDASSSNMGSTRQQQMVGAASPVREVTNSASSRGESLSSRGAAAGLVYLIAPLLLALPAW